MRGGGHCAQETPFNDPRRSTESPWGSFSNIPTSEHLTLILRHPRDFLCSQTLLQTHAHYVPVDSELRL